MLVLSTEFHFLGLAFLNNAGLFPFSSRLKVCPLRKIVL
jgi:hypothetical protein